MLTGVPAKGPGVPTEMRARRHHGFAPRVGLALGGGGARGLAHVGVLQALEEHGVPVDLIVGTSMGAIIGALYAERPDAEAVRRRLLDLLASGILRGSGVQVVERLERIARNKVLGPPVEHLIRLYRVYQHATRDHLIRDGAIRQALLTIFEDRRIEDLKIPFACVAVDLITGERVIFDYGPIREAILTSASIPGMFPPVRWRNRHLVDGGVLSLVPIGAAYALGADLVIAVDVSPVLNQNPNIGNASDILLRCDDLTARAFNAHRLAQADIAVSPLRTDSSWADFDEAEGLIDAGYAGAQDCIPHIRQALRFPRSLLKILRRRIAGRTLDVDAPTLHRVGWS